MRTIKFRDVLYAVAYHTGQDPLRGNFLTNQAIPVGESINQWLRREYDSRDWPEWSITDFFFPIAHIVPYNYEVPDSSVTRRIGKVLKVYLVDPSGTISPVEAPDWRLTDQGIHCGFKHGTRVWIKYIAPAPRVTAEAWKAESNYSVDDVVYLPRTGEVYRSRINNNKNYEPAPSNTFRDGMHFYATPPVSEFVAAASPGQAGIPAQNQILDITHVVATEQALGGGPSFIQVLDESFAIIGSTGDIAHVDGDTSVSIITRLKDALDADPGMDGFSISLDTVNLKIRIEGAARFTAVAGYYVGPFIADPIVQVQPYNEGISAVPATKQHVRFTFTDDQAVEGAIYILNIIDLRGFSHSIEYTAGETDSIQSIMAGLAAELAPAAEDDDFLARVYLELNNDTKQLSVFSSPASVDMNIALPGQPQWELVQFPLVLFDPVVRGAVADTLKEWGQTQEGIAEEQQVPGESDVKAQTFTQTPNTLTEQNPPRSRYNL